MRKVLVFTLLMTLLTGAMLQAAAAKIKLEVSMAEWYVEEGKAFYREVVIPEFEKLYPDVEVELYHGGWGVDPLIVRYAGDTAPDVIQYGADKLGAVLPMLLPLNSFAEAWGELEDFAPSGIEGATVDGKLYGIPFSIDVRTFQYRRDLFEKNGINADKPPTTWNELAAYGKKVTRFDNEGNIVLQGFEASSHYINFAPFLFQAGGRYLSQDRTKASFGEEEAMRAAQFVQDLYHRYRISDPTGKTSGFKEGGAVMTAHAAAGTISAHGLPFGAEDLGIALPLCDREQTTVMMTDKWGIINQTKHTEIAWKWIQFVSSADMLADIARTNEIVPPRISFAEYSPWADDPKWRTIFESSLLAKSLPGEVPEFDYIGHKIIIPALEKIFFEGASVNILKEEARRATGYLKQE